MVTSQNGYIPIEGSVESGFELVREVFRDNFTERDEIGAACAVYHRGEKVVDLWGGYRDTARTKPWREDTIVLVFSTTKGIAAAAVALAESRDYFDYDDRIVDYWPEFGQHGKENVTIRELLGHRAGLATIDLPLDRETIAEYTELIESLAGKEPDWLPGRRHGYHAWSLGWYQSELIRRTDPQGRTIGEFFAEEITAPLELDLYIGLPEDVESDRIAELRGIQPSSMLMNIGSVPWRMLVGLMNPWSITRRAISPFSTGKARALNRPEYLAVEIPSGNGIGAVRDIAKLYGALAFDPGKLGIGEETLRELEKTPMVPAGGSEDVVLKMESCYNLGFWKPFDGFDFGSPRAFGTPGAGGSLGFADPERELGFAYAPNRMGTHVLDDPRAASLRRAAFECI